MALDLGAFVEPIGILKVVILVFSMIAMIIAAQASQVRAG